MWLPSESKGNISDFLSSHPIIIRDTFVETRARTKVTERKEGTAVHFGAFWDLAKIAWPRNRYLDADFGSGLPSEQTGSSFLPRSLARIKFSFSRGQERAHYRWRRLLCSPITLPGSLISAPCLVSVQFPASNFFQVFLQLQRHLARFHFQPFSIETQKLVWSSSEIGQIGRKGTVI